MENFLNTTNSIDTEEKSIKLNQAINILKELNIDADTAEVILHRLDLGNEVYSQLIGEERYITAEKVWNDMSNNDTLIYNTFDDYFFSEFNH